MLGWICGFGRLFAFGVSNELASETGQRPILQSRFGSFLRAADLCCENLLRHFLIGVRGNFGSHVTKLWTFPIITVQTIRWVSRYRERPSF